MGWEILLLLVDGVFVKKFVILEPDVDWFSFCSIILRIKNKYNKGINLSLAIDLRKGKKNLDVLIKKLIEINDEGKVELSNIAKDISNKIVYIYDNLVTAINEQRSENLKLQLEISNMTKEKNSLRHEVELLTEAVRKLEVSLGVEQSPPFEKMLEYASQ